MTIAICVFCGEQKWGALNDCKHCGRTPKGADLVAKSMVLSDNFINPTNLDKIVLVIKHGQDPFRHPKLKQMYENVLPSISDENGDLDLTDLKEWLDDQSVSVDSPSKCENVNDSLKQELSDFLARIAPEYAILKLAAISKQKEKELLKNERKTDDLDSILDTFKEKWKLYLKHIRSQGFTSPELKSINDDIYKTCLVTQKAMYQIHKALANEGTYNPLDPLDQDNIMLNAKKLDDGFSMLRSNCDLSILCIRDIKKLADGLNVKYDSNVLRNILVSSKGIVFSEEEEIEVKGTSINKEKELSPFRSFCLLLIGLCGTGFMLYYGSVFVFNKWKYNSGGYSIKDSRPIQSTSSEQRARDLLKSEALNSGGQQKKSQYDDIALFQRCKDMLDKEIETIAAVGKDISLDERLRSLENINRARNERDAARSELKETIPTIRERTKALEAEGEVSRQAFNNIQHLQAVAKDLQEAKILITFYGDCQRALNALIHYAESGEEVRLDDRLNISKCLNDPRFALVMNKYDMTIMQNLVARREKYGY